MPQPAQRDTRDDAPDLSSRTPLVPSIARSVRALGALPGDLRRPRRPGKAFGASLREAGFPSPTVSVSLAVLRQVPRSVPTMTIVQGLREPSRVFNSMTAFVVRHPGATFLVDPAICENVHGRVLPQLPRPLRAVVSPPADVISVRQGLDEIGIAASDIDFALPTHLHWDHVSGLVDLPSTRLHTNRAEWTWAMEGTRAPLGVARRALEGREADFYELDGPPVLTFERSHDLFGDGSVVLVDMPGHTPGSIGVLLYVGTEDWVLLAGDSVWHTLQVERIRPKGSFPGRLADADPDVAFETVQRLGLLDPRVRVIPTHDHDASTAYAQETRSR